MMVKPKPTKPQQQAQTGLLLPLDEAMSTLKQMQSRLTAHSSQFDKILQAIQDTKSSLEQGIDFVSQDVGVLRADQHKLTDRVQDAETTLYTVKPTVDELQTQMKQLNTEVMTLHRTMEDAEGRS
ncbi:hypothetical protein NDU88_007389, partial [Pleurodeles waltl]